MCLILMAVDMHPEYRLILAANRDEYYDRPASPLSYWPDVPYLLAGRDLRAGGTWLGFSRQGRIAALTNYRDPSARIDNAPSRGLLVSDFLTGSESPPAYLHRIRRSAHRYSPFNLLVGDRDLLYYYSNRNMDIWPIGSGIHGISNHLLDTPWPKVQKGKELLAALLKDHKAIAPQDLFGILADRSFPSADLLPDTGVEPQWERILSPVFITSPTYGTRSASVLIARKSGRTTVAERTFTPLPGTPARFYTRTFRFRITL